MSPDEIERIGFGRVGPIVRISRFARFYGAEKISLGDEVRIDDFAILSPGDGEIVLADHVHIAAGAMLFGDVRLGSWSTLSSRVAVYAVSDDFTIDATTYPHGDQRTRAVTSDPVAIGDRVVIGTGSTLLPGVRIVSGTAVGAMSLVTTPIDTPGLYAGIPVRRLGSRTPWDMDDRTV
jgi:galactoside O-acetyltransferase